MIDGLPIGNPRRVIDGNTLKSARANNQFAISGSNPTLKRADIIVFLEYVSATGTFILKDYNGVAVSTAITGPLDFTAAPLRLDGGIEITGTVTIAKGFYVVISQNFDSIS